MHKGKELICWNRKLESNIIIIPDKIHNTQKKRETEKIIKNKEKGKKENK
jgi:hypothetical protein